jgi:hypothetical protein
VQASGISGYFPPNPYSRVGNGFEKVNRRSRSVEKCGEMDRHAIRVIIRM